MNEQDYKKNYIVGRRSKNDKTEGKINVDFIHDRTFSRKQFKIKFEDWILVYYELLRIITTEPEWKRYNSLPFKKIFEYYRKPSFYQIQNMSQTNGTVQQIKKKVLKDGMKLLLSNELAMRIIEAHAKKFHGSCNFNLLEQDQKYLLHLMLTENAAVQGLKPCELKALQEKLEDFEMTYHDELKQCGWEASLPISLPYLKLETMLKSQKNQNQAENTMHSFSTNRIFCW